MSKITSKPMSTSKLRVKTMGVPEIKRYTNVCGVRERGVNEETITSKPGYEEASTVKHLLK